MGRVWVLWLPDAHMRHLFPTPWFIQRKELGASTFDDCGKTND